MTAIRLFRGDFGHVSMLNAASDLVTHAHPELHVILWLDGDPGRMRVGETEVVLGPDVAAGVNSLEPHSHSFEPGGSPGFFLAFYIDPDWVARRRTFALGARLFQASAIPVGPWLRSTCLDLFHRLAHDAGDLEAYEVERLIDSLIEASEAAVSQPARAEPDVRLDFRVRKAIALMRENICDRMSLDEVARSVGLSRPHFFSLFKEQTKLTPNVYRNTLRMEEALRQIQTSEESLTAVASSLGFTAQANFTRFFRDHAGVPPTLYREAARLDA